MPIYDYVCGSCRHRFEVFHGLNEQGPKQCPLCGGPVTRAFVPPTIHFKGTGWAKLDRRSAATPRKKSRSGDEGGGGGDAPPTSEKGADASTGDAKGGTSGDTGSSGEASAAAPSSETTNRSDD